MHLRENYLTFHRKGLTLRACMKAPVNGLRPDLVAKKKKMCIVCANMLVSASAFFDFLYIIIKKKQIPRL